jgi:dipeptidyl-peptidase-4
MGSSSTFAQKEITLEDIWAKPTFRQKSIQNLHWTQDGQSYLELKDGKILKYNVLDPSKFETLFDEAIHKTSTGETIHVQQFALSSDEQSILIGTASEPMYRRSSKENNYIFIRTNNTLKQLSQGGKQMHATFSPDGKRVAFVRENNLFWTDVISGKETAVTSNGKFNHIINGACDWVYEEEFSFAKAFAWSPDSKKIAFYTFDESQVPEYNMQMWGDLYPKDYRYQYPKAGEANSIVSLSVALLDQNKIQAINVGPEKNQYIPRLKWTNNPEVVGFIRLNRLQNHMELLHHSISKATTSLIYEERAETSIEIEAVGNDFTYLKDGKSFLFSSERSGFKHLYVGEIATGKFSPITSGNWEVDDLYGYNEKNKTLYFNSTELSPIGRQVYSINLDGSGKKAISSLPGTNTASFSPDFSYYMLNNSSAKKP